MVKLLASFALIAVAYCGYGYLFQVCWNFIVPDLFGLRPVAFNEAIILTLLVTSPLILKSFIEVLIEESVK